MVKKSPFKNVHDVKIIAHKAFASITPDEVRNCYDHVEEQEIFYRHLHNLQPLPVENIEEEELPENLFPEVQTLATIDAIPISEDEIQETIIEPEIDYEQEDSNNHNPYQCKTCDVSFTGSNASRDFNRHLRKHEPKQPQKPRKSRAKNVEKVNEYPCSKCDKKFQFQSYLLRHIENVHEIRGNKVKRKIDFQELSSVKTNQLDEKTAPSLKRQRKQKIVLRNEF